MIFVYEHNDSGRVERVKSDSELAARKALPGRVSEWTLIGVRRPKVRNR